MLLCTRSPYNDAKELAIQTHSEIREGLHVFVEDAGRHWGRRARRLRFRLEFTEQKHNFFGHVSPGLHP